MRSRRHYWPNLLAAFFGTYVLADLYLACWSYLREALAATGYTRCWNKGIAVDLPFLDWQGPGTPTLFSLATALEVVPVILCAMAAYAILIRREEIQCNKCLRCGHILKELTEARCPECREPI